MIGTQTVNNLFSLLYETLVLCWLFGLAIYDIMRKRVPDRTLVFFCPVALLSMPVHMYSADGCASFLSVFLFSLAGCAVGFFILLTAAMLSKGGMGLGGGDIKLAAVIGFIYGPYRMLEILILASFLSAGVALVIGCRRREKALSLPFVPFIAISSLTALTASII